MNIFKKIIVSFILIAFILLTGCASQNIPLSPQNRATIHTVYVNPHVQKPKEMFFYGRTLALSQSFFGVIGAAVAYRTNENQKLNIQTAVEKNRIDVAEIVRTAFDNQLKKGGFKLVDNQHADAVMEIKIINYGFIAKGLAMTETPLLKVEAQLIDKKKQVIWRDANFWPYESDTPQSSYDTLVKNPDNIRKAWISLSPYIAKRVLGDLVNNKGAQTYS